MPETTMFIYLSKLSRSGFADFSSGVLYTMGTPGLDGFSAKITRSPVKYFKLERHGGLKLGKIISINKY